MTQIENIAPKMDLSSLVSSSKSPRRRHAGGSLSGSLCGGSQNLVPGSTTGGSLTNSHGGSAPRLYSTGSKSTSELEGLRNALQDRDAVIHNLRAQLGVHYPPTSSLHSSGNHKKQHKNDSINLLNQQRSNLQMSDAERVIAKRRLATLKLEADRKKDAIGELKKALRKLDVTDNIDVRIKQAELEYALGREELDLLSISEELRSLQGRIEQAQGSPEQKKTIFSWLKTGVQLSLVAVTVSCDPSRPRWGVTFNNNNNNNKDGTNFGLYIDWAAEGEPLRKGDRLLEVNGKILGASRNLSQSSTLDELSRLLAVSYDPAEIVVLRPRRSHSQNLDSNYSTTLTSSSNSANRRLKADNLRLTHRICYLEEQVRELQTKDQHITSINVTDSLNPANSLDRKPNLKEPKDNPGPPNNEIVTEKSNQDVNPGGDVENVELISVNKPGDDINYNKSNFNNTFVEPSSIDPHGINFVQTNQQISPNSNDSTNYPNYKNINPIQTNDPKPTYQRSLISPANNEPAKPNMDFTPKPLSNGFEVPETVEVFRRGSQVATLLRGKIVKQHHPMDEAFPPDWRKPTMDTRSINSESRSESRCSSNSVDKNNTFTKNYTRETQFLSQEERINRLKNESLMNSSQNLNKTDVNGDQMNGEVVNGDVCENGVKLGADMQYDGSRMTNPRTPPVRPERPEVKRRSRTKQLFHYSSARSADEPISIPINSIDNRKIIDMRFDKAERAEVLSNGAEATSLDHRWDERSSKSLEFERCSANSLRPTPPKKPLRLSLHRARSLQTVQSPVVPDQQNSVTDLYSKVDSKRPSKRTHNLAKRVLHQHIL